ncbi:hypothetical protein [Streptomyces omiyaensis]|uniref:hypothetical protein n=1 Tax=Streptomyces omiyaensis TaxID=68247 RepID=UPI003700FD73
MPKTHARRARTAVNAMLNHPQGTRAPVPSAKAARAALRSTGALSRAARRAEGNPAAADMVAIVVQDALADAFHYGRTLVLSPQDLDQLHLARLSGRPFPDWTTDRSRALACHIGNLRQLASAYGLCEDHLLASAEQTYKHEIA